ncbi:unnamed protein product [Caenorhabditis brenneri]
MAQSVPPGDIQTQPEDKITFTTPFDEKKFQYVTLINSSARQLGYALKTTDMKRIGVDPPCGVLDPKKAVLLAVSCDAFAHGQEDKNNDRITVEWTNTPDGIAKQFSREWFHGDGMVRRKDLSIEYKTEKITTPEDTTQSDRSGEGTPVLGLSSKMRHVAIARGEEEEVPLKKTMTPITYRFFYYHLMTMVNSTVPAKDAERLENRISEKPQPKDSLITPNRLKFLLTTLCYGIEETAAKAYESSDTFYCSLTDVYKCFRDFVSKLGAEGAIDDWDTIIKGSEEKKRKKVIPEILLSAITLAIEKA